MRRSVEEDAAAHHFFATGFIDHRGDILNIFDPLDPKHRIAGIGRHDLDSPHAHHALDKTLREAQSIATDTVNRLCELGVTEVEEGIIAGQAATVILDVAESRQPDVIVLGARGLGVWSGLILGSTSMAVVQRASCPVLVIK